MQKLTRYIAEVFNIKANSEYMIQDMIEEISKVKDIVAYRSYIKRFMFSESVQYANGIQKFIILTNEYLDLEKASCRRLGIETKEEIELKKPFEDLDNRLLEIMKNTTKEIT